MMISVLYLMQYDNCNIMWPVIPKTLAHKNDTFDQKRQPIINNLQKYGHDNILKAIEDSTQNHIDSILRQLVGFDFEEYEALKRIYYDTHEEAMTSSKFQELRSLDQSDIERKSLLKDADELVDIGLKTVAQGKGNINSWTCYICGRRCPSTWLRGL